MHSSRPANTVYSPPNGFFRKYKSNLKRIAGYEYEQQKQKNKTVRFWFVSEKEELHGAFVVLAGFPVSVGHGKLVEIGEERRDHWIGGAGEDLAVGFGRHSCERSQIRLLLCCCCSLSGSGFYINEFGSAEGGGRVRCVAWGIRHENGGGLVVVGFYRERETVKNEEEEEEGREGERDFGWGQRPLADVSCCCYHRAASL